MRTIQFLFQIRPYIYSMLIILRETLHFLELTTGVSQEAPGGNTR